MKTRIIALIAAWAVITLLNVLLLPPHLAPKIHVEALQAAPMPLIVSAPGSVQAKRSLVVKAEFEGEVIQKLYKEGDNIKEGALLLEVGRQKIQQEYESKRYAVENAESDLRKAYKDLALQKALFRKQAVARQSVDDAARALERAHQQVEIARTSFRVEADRWKKSRVIAPFQGTIVKDSLEDEMNVTAGKELLILADVSELAVRARVNELEIRDIAVGQQAEVDIQAVNAAPLRGTVQSLGSRAESAIVPEIPVTLKLDSTSTVRLLPNMTADVRIYTGVTPPILSVPLTALGGSAGRNYVWTVDALRRLRQRKVEVGKSNPDRAEILRGLNPGDRVCVQNQSSFAEGLRVTILE